MKFAKTINCILRIFAVFALLFVAVWIDCPAQASSESVNASSRACCAYTIKECSISSLASDCCCRPTPLDTAVTPGLIFQSSPQFDQVVSLRPSFLLPNYFAQKCLSQSKIVADVGGPKIYIFYRALLI